MGWVFPASDKELAGAERDPLNGAKSIRELYEIASTKYSGKYTVPVWSIISSANFIKFHCSLLFSDYLEPNDYLIGPVG